MSEHKATIRWNRNSQDFLQGKYSREHTWVFDGGITVPASPSPAIVPAPWSNPAAVDPEEAFIASVASCHMLTFLYLAYRQGYQVDSYEDAALGMMSKNEKGVLWMKEITLYPQVEFSGPRQPSRLEEERLHQSAHEHCFIANSIRTNVRVNDGRRH